MRNTFKDITLQKEFESKGYILIDSFLTPLEVNELRTWYDINYHDEFFGFHASMHSLDFDYRRKVHSKIATVFFQKADNLLSSYRPVVGNFTVKESGVESFFDFHLDWSMLNEKKARSITIWVALEDTNAKNGNLWILEGSTHLGNTWRCSSGLQLFADSRINFNEKKFEKKILPMKAGDAIIYDHKLIHGSPANMSGTKRMAINLAMLPKEISSLHYHVENDIIKIYEIDDDFYNTCLTHQKMDFSNKFSKNMVFSDVVRIGQSEINKLILC